MKFSEFKNNATLLIYFGLSVKNEPFIDLQTIVQLPLSPYLEGDFAFVLANRGNTAMEFYACEALIFPILKEVWKRNPKIKVFSHRRFR